MAAWPCSPCSASSCRPLSPARSVVRFEFLTKKFDAFLLRYVGHLPFALAQGPIANLTDHLDNPGVNNVRLLCHLISQWIHQGFLNICLAFAGVCGRHQVCPISACLVCYTEAVITLPLRAIPGRKFKVKGLSPAQMQQQQPGSATFNINYSTLFLLVLNASPKGRAIFYIEERVGIHCTAEVSYNLLHAACSTTKTDTANLG